MKLVLRVGEKGDETCRLPIARVVLSSGLELVTVHHEVRAFRNGVFTEWVVMDWPPDGGDTAREVRRLKRLKKDRVSEEDFGLALSWALQKEFA